MGILQLPSSILLLILAATASRSAASTAFSSASRPTASNNVFLPSTGSGFVYASQCLSASSSYASASSSWSSANATVSVDEQVYGGTFLSSITYYVNATTLCDGHARVTYSPAVTLTANATTVSSSLASTSSYTYTVYYAYPSPSPSCSISPSDCDLLSAAYSTALASRKAYNATATNTPGAQLLPTPQPPACEGVKEAASIASVASSVIYGCGECTMFGEGVELVYFPVPTTVSRDMCASEPTASLTSYGSNAVIEAFAGSSYSGKAAATDGQETAIVGGHTFTSGTAYISIATVYAVDRCSTTKGTPVHDVILAMPSESVLSLRYSQDHFQYFMSSNSQTGYPVSYADFNHPVPWSAWNGQAICTNSYGGYMCDVVYENNYRPQLAIPPEIRKLSPDFETCQLWYGGLYDPPLALTSAESIAPITFAGGSAEPAPTSPSPGWGVTTRRTTATALPDQNGGDGVSTHQVTATALPEQNGGNGETTAVPSTPIIAPTISQISSVTRPTEAWTNNFKHGSHSISISADGGIAHVGSVVVSSEGPGQSLTDGLSVTYGGEGLVIADQSSVPLTHAGDAAGTTVITYEQITVTVVQSGPDAEISIDSTTLTPGGSAETIAGGYYASADSAGIVLGWSSTIASTGEVQTQSTEADEGGNSATSTASDATSAASGGTEVSTGSTAAETTSSSVNSGAQNAVPAAISLVLVFLLVVIIL